MLSVIMIMQAHLLSTTEAGIPARRRHFGEHGGLRRLPGDNDQSGTAVTESENPLGAIAMRSAHIEVIHG
jgi:hypothetical protein